MRLLKAAVFFFVGITILVFVVTAQGQEVDPAKRLAEVQVMLLRVEGMLQYNTQVRNEAAENYANLTRRQAELRGILADLQKKSQPAEPVEPTEETTK